MYVIIYPGHGFGLPGTRRTKGRAYGFVDGATVFQLYQFTWEPAGPCGKCAGQKSRVPSLIPAHGHLLKTLHLSSAKNDLATGLDPKISRDAPILYS